MAANKTGNNKFLKEYNEAGILDLIRTGKALSRADLSKATGLSPTATGIIVSALIEKGYIRERGTGESTGGRRPVLLELAPESYYSIGFDVDVGSVLYIVMDITGKVVYEGSADMDTGTPEAAVSALGAYVDEIIRSREIDKERLLGVGISVPGLVEPDTQRVILAPNLGWEDVDLGAMLKEKLEMPVHVENEAMASAICENWIGECREIDNFICVNIKSGIGAGIFTGGRPYKGSSGSAGEVGHVVVDEDGPKCGCGNHGCLETIASTSRIVDKARKIARQDGASFLCKADNSGSIDLDNIIYAARAGNEKALVLLNDAARYIGIALSSLVNTLNPSKIVLGKDFVKYGDLVMNTIRGMIERKALKKPASVVEVTVSEFGERASTLGAAIIPLKILFGR